jgi:hypothetical protein
MDDPKLSDPSGTTSSPCPVAETMHRVHDQLRRGATPTFEALFAFGGSATR